MLSGRNTLMHLLVLAMLCGAACRRQENAETATAEGSADQLTIAVIPKCTSGEFWETVEQGARDAASDLGVAIKWEGTLTETEIAEQNKIIENMINLGVDGIAIAPLNNKANARSVATAVDAGIPVAVFDSDIDGDKHFAFVATDNVAGGVLGARRLVERLGEGPKQILMLRYVQGTASTENRAQGFIKTAEGNGYQIVADPYPEDGSVAGCKKTASNTLEGFVSGGQLELDGIFACNLNSALGMLAALEDLRKSNVDVSAVFVGFDTSPKLLEAVQSGAVDALVAQDSRKMGFLAVEAVAKKLNGESVEAVVDTGLELITKERLENDAAIRELVGLEDTTSPESL